MLFSRLARRSGGDANKLDPKLVKFAKPLEIHRHLLLSLKKKQDRSRAFTAQKLVNATATFICRLGAIVDFEGTLFGAIALFKNLVLQKTGKQVARLRR